jgi:hypothetical protein
MLSSDGVSARIIYIRNGVRAGMKKMTKHPSFQFSPFPAKKNINPKIAVTGAAKK